MDVLFDPGLVEFFCCENSVTGWMDGWMGEGCRSRDGGGEGGTNNTCDPTCVRHVSIPPNMSLGKERKIRGRIGQVVYEKQKKSQKVRGRDMVD